MIDIGPALKVKRAIKLVVSLGITAISFWWTFKDVRWEEMKTSLTSANYWKLVPYALILAGIHMSRTLRWGNLLSGMEKVPFKKLNEASAIGFMMLIILPFRLGEFARPFLIAERSTIRRSPAMTSVVLERIIDGIIIAVLLRVLIFFMPGESVELGRVRVGANLMFLVFGGGLTFLLIARWQEARVLSLMRLIGNKVSPGLTEKIVYVVQGFVGALRQLPDAKNMALFVLFTASYWLLNGYGMSLVASAFDCSGAGTASCQPLTMTTLQGFFVLCVLIVGMMIPAAPGSAGTFQAFAVLGMTVFLPRAVVDSSGIAYANVLWVVQILQQVAYGVLMLVVSNSSFSRIAGKLDDEQQAAEQA